MKLIADCGSTKIHWCLIDGNKVASEVYTPGMNAVMLTEEEMRARLADELMPQLPQAPQVEEIYFYGAGCISPEVCDNVRRALASNIAASVIEVDTDLLGAARGLCGRNPGIACIMGTGSNSCFYDGERIVANVSPLGYILGDEGSGAVIGRLFLGDVLKNQLPEDLRDSFLNEYHLDRMEVIRRVYREPNANRFLATVLPFLSKNIHREEIHALVRNAFCAFFRRNIHQYSGYESLKVNFIGSVAYYFREVLEEAAADCGCTVGTIIQSPMPGLIEYHTA